jgi:phosphatidate cytidylyltransferase
MLRHRLIFGTTMIAACLGLAGLDAWLARQSPPDFAGGLGAGILTPLYNGGPIVLVLAAVVLWAAIELGGLLRQAGYRPITYWGAATAALATLSPWLASSLHYPDPWKLACLALIVSLAGAVLWRVGRGEVGGAIGSVASTVLITTYVGLLGSFMVGLRVSSPGSVGAWLVLYVIMVVKVTDIGAYFVGSAVGRHKLAPRVSPGKTWEGLAGGVFAAGLAAVFLAWVGGIMVADGARDVWPGPARAAFFGIVMAVTGQLGDLVESLLKRDAGQKDSSCSIPGFGGVLDLVDSPLFAAPLAWWMLT